MTSPTDDVCFVAEHEYSSDARGDHMIRVVSPQGVFAECVGTPGAELVLRTPADHARAKQGETHGQQLSGPESAQVPVHSDPAKPGRTPGGSEHAEAPGNPEKRRDSAAAAGSTQESLKVRPDTEMGLRAIVVFPSDEEDDERDVTARTDFTSSRPDVVSVNNTRGSARGQIHAHTHGTATIMGRYSGMLAKRKVIVVDKTATAVRITAATGKTTVDVGAILPLRGAVTYDSGQSEQVTEDITWSSSDASIADVDSGGEVEGVSPGSATITGTYTNKDGTELSDDLEITVTGSDGSGDSARSETGSDRDSSNGAGQQSSGEGGSQSDSQEST